MSSARRGLPIRPQLRRSLIIDILLLLCGLAALVSGVTYIQFRDAGRALVKAHMRTIADHTRTQLTGFLEPTRVTADVARELASQEVVGLHERSNLRALFLAYLGSHDQIQNIYFGDEEANFYMLSRRAEGGYREKRIVVKPYAEVKGRPPTALLRYFDQESKQFQMLLAELADAERDAPAARDAADDALRTLARKYPFAKQLIVGYPNGDFHKVTRSPPDNDGHFELTSTWRTAAGIEETRAADGAWAAPVQMPKPYDPRTRDWYRDAAAAEAGAMLWSNLYEFFGGAPGVTAASPVFTGGDAPQLKAVVGFDLEFKLYDRNASGEAIEPTIVATFYNRIVHAHPDDEQRWSPTVGKEDLYDCRTRPWYISARKTDGLALTDVYLFSDSQMPGVSFSSQARRHDRLMGVVGVDVNVFAISQFLKRTSKMLHGGDGLAFIVNQSNRLIGFPSDEVSEIISPTEPGKLRTLDQIEALQGIDLSAARPQTAETEEDTATERLMMTWTANDRAFIAERTLLERLSGGRTWYLWVVMPEDTFMEPVNRNMLVMIALSAVGALVAVLLTGRMRRRIAEPLERLVDAFESVQQGEYFDVKLYGDPNYHEIQTLYEGFGKMLLGLQERHHLMRYVSHATLQAIAHKAREAEHSLGGERVRRTVWFSDVRGFTAFSERNTPEAVINMLNVYLNVQAKILEKHGGDIDKFVGDEIMCLFQGEDAEARAVAASLEVIAAVREKNREDQLGIAVGIGINTGDLVSGNMGAEGRMDYTVIGDTVNFGARLCDAAQPDQILVSAAVWNALDGRLQGERIEGFRAKGKTGELEVYAVTGWAPDPAG